jgi:hypothetical protein
MVLGSGISAELTESSKWALLSSVIELGYSVVLISQMMPMPQGSGEANGVQGELRSLHCMCTTYMYDICMFVDVWRSWPWFHTQNVGKSVFRRKTLLDGLIV